MTELVVVAGAVDSAGRAGGDRLVGTAETADTVARELMGLRIDPGSGRGELVAVPHLLNAVGGLWGGAGLAVALALGAQVLERPPLRASVQYISPIRAGERLELRVEPGHHGRQLSQAVVRGTVEGRLALVATGTFGEQAGDGRSGDAVSIPDGPADRQLVAPPAGVPAPEQCPERTVPADPPGAAPGMRGCFEERWARPMPPELTGSPSDGRSVLWLRPRAHLPMSAVLLALLADFAPAAISVARGVHTYGASLDNSIRVVDVPTDQAGNEQIRWVLLDVRVEALVRGVAQLHTRMFDEDGRLLATAGQSMIESRPPWL
ncbi:thioesterase family protein [Frankia sp. CNm7]|uniref:Thioesterase family protein n=1 Tax=Frankia nepalensis TaxID=1836974 RepID=A0A937UMU0_9ACTN|nr:thioesterase family protein [Frankia nepalensis]MBL7496664.1 thioesterase family protein [Frankia nepalensis]MBL7510694.1 thioesterase family protein [Frankia nepalensis]MBL7516673.1 thioesterase family protein [Frankia nepalensis]MBL7627403.1 thioesterase family protein [Frankia nepalensis]